MKARVLFLLLLVFLLVFAVACTVSTETMGGEGDTTDTTISITTRCSPQALRPFCF